LSRKPFLVERRAIAPRQRQTRTRAVYVERKAIPQTGRIAREIARALRMSPMKFPRSWLTDY
jgi:hypothetical protein